MHRTTSQALAHQTVPKISSGTWQRAISTLVYVLGFGLIAIVLHEFFHFVTLRALGGEGYITFDWEFGLTHFTQLPAHLWAVQLSGGLLAGAFLLVVLCSSPNNCLGILPGDRIICMRTFYSVRPSRDVLEVPFRFRPAPLFDSAFSFSLQTLNCVYACGHAFDGHLTSHYAAQPLVVSSASILILSKTNG